MKLQTRYRQGLQAADGLPRTGGPAAKLRHVAVSMSLSSSLAIGQSTSSLPLGPSTGLLMYPQDTAGGFPQRE